MASQLKNNRDHKPHIGGEGVNIPGIWEKLVSAFKHNI